VAGCGSLATRTRPLAIERRPGFNEPAAQAEEELKLTLLTYNVWGLPHWMNHAPRARYARIASGIERLHPDLVLLQEVWTKPAAAVAPTNAEWLVAQAGSPNFFRRNGLMVLSRLPIVGGEFHPFSHAAFPDSVVRKGALKVTLRTASGRRLNVWNVHLQSDAPRVRMRQIEQLTAWVREAEDGQVADLVGGDFNSTPDSPEFQRLSRELGPTAHELARAPFAPTYDGLSPDPKQAQTIDYLFIRPRAPMDRLEAAPKLVLTNPDPRQRCSDHVALQVDLRLRSGNLLVQARSAGNTSPQPVAYSPAAEIPLGH